MSDNPRHDPATHDCRGGVRGDRYPLSSDTPRTAAEIHASRLNHPRELGAAGCVCDIEAASPAASGDALLQRLGITDDTPDYFDRTVGDIRAALAASPPLPETCIPSEPHPECRYANGPNIVTETWRCFRTGDEQR